MIELALLWWIGLTINLGINFYWIMGIYTLIWLFVTFSPMNKFTRISKLEKEVEKLKSFFNHNLHDEMLDRPTMTAHEYKKFFW